MRRVSAQLAAGGFFVLAAAAWSGGASPLTCGLRGLAGAAGVYVLTRVAGAVVLGLMVRAILQARTPSRERQTHGSTDI